MTQGKTPLGRTDSETILPPEADNDHRPSGVRADAAKSSPEEAVHALRKVATGLARDATELEETTVPDGREASGFGASENVLSMTPIQEELRILEARLFASEKPLTANQLAESLPGDCDVQSLLAALKEQYADRGVNLVRVGGRWSFRTAEDLAYVMERHAVEERRLSRAALETLAIIAYHQPTTRAEIEEVRGVSTSKGTLDALMDIGWIRPRGRRRAPGKPVTYGTTDEFLVHFGLDSLGDLPGLGELKGAGLLDAALPPDFRVPQPKELASLLPDELPLDEEDEEGHVDATEAEPELELDDDSDESASDGDHEPRRRETPPAGDGDL